MVRGALELHEDEAADMSCALLDEDEKSAFEALGEHARWSIERAMGAPIWLHLRRAGLRLEAKHATFSTLARWRWRGELVVLGVGLEHATLEGESRMWMCVLIGGRMMVSVANAPYGA